MRERVRLGILVLAIPALLPRPAIAQDAQAAAHESPDVIAPAALVPQDTNGYVTGPGWRVEFMARPVAVAPVLALPLGLTALAQDPAPQHPRPVAFEYSDAYQKRRKIHVYASFAMVPLFITQFALGNSLYTNSTDSKRTAHAIVGSGIGVLFGINTVTGVWNLWEGRKNPTGRARRFTHGIMMLGADAGFVATALLAPGDDGSGNKTAHRAVALTSIGVATASYVFMLLTR